MMNVARQYHVTYDSKDGKFLIHEGIDVIEFVDNADELFHLRQLAATILNSPTVALSGRMLRDIVAIRSNKPR